MLQLPIAKERNLEFQEVVSFKQKIRLGMHKSVQRRHRRCSYSNCVCSVNWDRNLDVVPAWENIGNVSNKVLKLTSLTFVNVLIARLYWLFLLLEYSVSPCSVRKKGYIVIKVRKHDSVTGTPLTINGLTFFDRNKFYYNPFYIDFFF